jgi:hypothetical protein
LRSALLHALSPDDVRRIARAMVNRAACGDVATYLALMAYVVGKPGSAQGFAEPEQREERIVFSRMG